MTNSAWCVAAEAQADVQVRHATLADAPGIARVHVLSWQATYPGILPSAEIERHTLASRTANWTRALHAPGAKAVIWVAVRAHEVLGFASSGAFRIASIEKLTGESHPASAIDGHGDGELNALYLLPDAHRQGIGRQLFEASAGELHAAGFRAMRCWVLHGNPAVGFYERLGGVRIATKTYAAEGAVVPEHCYRFALFSRAWLAQLAA